LRTIGLRASGIYVNKFDGSETIRTIETRVTLPVPLATTVVTCADPPTAPTGESAVPSVAPRGARLSWNKSAMDTGDPEGALYYVVERLSGGGWVAVGIVNAAGENSYTLHDPRQSAAGVFEYRVSVIGCGGTISATATLGSVIL
jgi:hypothetical protein